MTHWAGTASNRGRSELSGVYAPLLTLRTIDGEVVKVNERVCEVINARSEQIIGRNWRDYIRKDAASTHKRVIDTLVSTGAPQRINEIWIKSDGAPFHTSSFYSLMSAKYNINYVLCESYLIDQEPAQATLSGSAIEEISFIAENLNMLSALAARSEMEVLDYSIRMALSEAKKVLIASTRKGRDIRL